MSGQEQLIRVLLVFIPMAVAAAADLRRRRAQLRATSAPLLIIIDVAALAGVAALPGMLLELPIAAIGAVLATWFLWSIGAHSLRVPRPSGEVLGNALLAFGAILAFVTWLLQGLPYPPPKNWYLYGLLSVATGAVLLIVLKKQFKAIPQERRIVQHANEQGEVLQPEYHRATPECPNPERWRMYDSMTAEFEVLHFLKQLVLTLKPRFIVETGTFMGISTIWMAEGLRENGFGKIVTCEFDPVVFAKAKERIEAAGVGEWVEYRNESSLELKVDGEIDLLFSDSDINIREQEVHHFLPQLNPTGIILMHDASSHLKTVRDAAIRLEQEGLISIVLLPTPRGLVLAQKRQGRK